MKKTLQVYLRSLLLSGMFLVMGINSYANHISAMDLSYAFVSSTGSGATLSSVYLVTVTIYGNCSDMSGAYPTLPVSSPQVCIYNGTALFTTLNLTIQAPTNGVNVTNVCTADTGLTTCTSLTNTINGNQKFIYTATVTLTGTSAVWRFVYGGYNGTAGAEAGRSNQISSIVSPMTSVVRLVDTLNNTAGPNTSTSLPIIPTPYYCQSEPDNYNPGGTNADGDSLVFQLVTPVTGTGINTCTSAAGPAVTYLTGYSTADPIDGATAFAFNSVNGQISFTTPDAQTTVVDYNIREFRAGVLVGTCMREMNITVAPCSTPAPTGTIRTPVNGAITSDSTTFEACENSGVFSFTIVSAETDPSFLISMIASNVPVGATYVLSDSGTNHAFATFTWTSTGVTPGTYPFDILFSSNSCPVPSSGSIAYNVIIEPVPSAIGGTPTVCAGSTVTLTDTLAGGTWTSSNTALATAGSATGVISGVGAGLDTIAYSFSAAACKVSVPVTVTGPAAITGTKTTCPTLTTTLTETVTGGTWSSSNTAVATVGSTGVVTGVAGGTSNITYTITSSGCFAIAQVTVTALAAITPTSGNTVCIGNTITLADATSGGVWSSSSTALATVSSTGIVGGVAAGSVTIFYTVGSCFASAVVTVSATGPAAITPATAVSVCVGGTATLADASTGGTWSSSTVGIATVGTTTGIVTGAAAGAATISYFLGGCHVTKAVTVISGIAAITPATPPTICIANTTTLAETTTGGTWSSSNLTVATVGTGGVVTGVAAGTATIDYSIGTCFVSVTVTVEAGPVPISPVGPVVCLGTTSTLTDATTGGTWSSSAAAVASVTAGGVVTGATAGTATISYTEAGCSATVVASVIASPAAITGAHVVCTNNTITLVETSTGGTWSSSAPTIASVVTGGVVTGVAAGTATITYAIGSCDVTYAVTVNLSPALAVIGGASTVCIGGTTTLTDATTGGTWSSVTTAVATITAGGVVSGVSSGTSLISYSLVSGCGTTAVTHIVSVNISPSAGTITGTTSICAGTTSLLADAVTGGTWSGTNHHSTINAAGLVTAVSAGIDTITYTVTSSCGPATVTQVITVGAFLTAGTITSSPTAGVTNICGGTTLTLADASTGGTWSSSNASASVSTAGVVTGAATGGVDTISYTIASTCGTTAATYVLTVNPTVSSPVIGSSTLCIGASSLFTDATAGGVWSSSNINAAVNSTSGLVTGVAIGAATISYIVSNTCGSFTEVLPVTVSATVNAGTITGSSSSLCIGTSTALTDVGGSGGVWSSSSSSASVTSSGIVTGLAAGTATISYTVSASCGTAIATFPITVTTVVITAGTISGASSVCVSSLIPLTDAVGGGAWSSSNANATITTGGIVTGITPGTDTISYTITSSCGIAQTTKIITINALAGAGTISGPSVVCTGASITLTDPTPGGLWSSLNSNAVVNPSTGVVTGVSAGADVITYTATTTCGTVNAIWAITVSPGASAGSFTGPDSLCVGTSITLVDGVSGGVWTSGNANAIVTGGIVTGVAVGTAPISYTVTNSCGTATAVDIVSIVPSASAGVISGLSAVCVGSGITLTDGTPGGAWVASNGNAAVVGPGIIDGVTVGVDTIFYVVTNSCGTSTASKILAIHPVPVVDPVTGPTHQCTSTLILLLDGVSGGIWTSNDTLVADINHTTGVITGVGTGITTLTYTVTNVFGCPTTVTSLDTVTASPGLTGIMGSPTVCAGSTTTLTNTTAGGVWTSADPAVATIDPVSGVIAGISTGTVVISYSVVNSCGTSFITTAETVNPMAIVDPIAGAGVVCIGSSITLTDGTPGGVWNSSDATIATVNSATGVVTGVSAGSVSINYIYVGSCPVTVSATVSVSAGGVSIAPIAGATSECIGTSTLLSDATVGGVWSSSNPAIANISAGGLVTGTVAGTATISYSVTSPTLGCTVSIVAIDTVLAIPVESPIAGAGAICPGSDLLLSDAIPDGAWSSSNTGVAVVNPLTGLVTGVAGGTVRIYYTIADICGSARDSVSLTVGAGLAVSPIIAAYTSLCSGTTVHLTDGTSGGIWTSSNPAIASVNSTTGLVTGVSGGTDTVYYSLSVAGGCSSSAMISISIGGSISAGTVSPSGSVTLCHGHTIYMHVISASTTGTTYQWLLNGGAIAGATESGYTATSIGIYSAVIDNGICSETILGPDVISPPNPVISFNPPNILFTGTFPSYEWFLNGIQITDAHGSAITETAAGTYKVVVTDNNGCSDTSGGYVVTGSGINSVNTVTNAGDIKVYPNPASSMLYIDAPVNVNVSVLSIDGKVLISQKDATRIDVNQLAGGMYMIMIYDESGLLLKTTKFAKVE